MATRYPLFAIKAKHRSMGTVTLGIFPTFRGAAVSAKEHASFLNRDVSVSFINSRDEEADALASEEEFARWMNH